MGFWSNVFSRIRGSTSGVIPDTWSAEFTKGLQLRSFTGIMLVNSIEIRKRNKSLKWAVKQLETKFTPEAVQKIYDDLSSSTSKAGFFDRIRLWRYQRRIYYFVKEFQYVYSIFKDYYTYTIAKISAVFRGGAREEYTELDDLEAVLRGLYPKMDQLIFPSGEVKIFRWQMKALIDDLESNLREEETDETRVSRGGHPVGASIFSGTRWKSTRSLIREELRKLVKMDLELRFYNRILNTIREELVSGVRQDLLFLLIEFFKRLDLAQTKFRTVKRDLQEIAKRLNDEFNKVHTSVDKIFSLFQNDPRVKGELAAVKQNMEELAGLIRDIEKANFRNTESIRKRLRSIVGEDNELLSVLEQKAVA